MAITKNKKYYTDRYGELHNEYSGDGWQDVHEDKTRYLYPHGRNLDDSKKDSDGERKDEYILNNTVLLNIRIAVSGLFSGITPPLEKWFRLEDEDKELNDTAAVTEFYQKATDTILLDMSKSNFYTIMELVYKDLLTYSISNIVVDEDLDRIFNFTHVPNGQYYIDTDFRGEVSGTWRKFRRRARDVISEYGLENVSNQVKAMIEGSKTGGQMVDLLHVIERNEGRDITKEDNQNMPWTSITYEVNGNDDNQKPLRKSGYITKPNAVPRWSVSSGNKYGNGPGDIALGDVKQLQKLMSKLMMAIEKDLEPPLTAPSGQIINTGPNEITEVDKINTTGRPLVEPLYRVTTDISKLVALIIDTQDRIRKAYFSDLFFAQETVTDPKKTATQVRAEQQELLRLLGPITQRMTPELLQAIIQRCFDIEFRLGRLPDVPEELVGRPIKIEIISSLTKAQELSVVGPIEQIIGMVANASQVWPEALDKVDIDQTIDEIKRVFGIPEGIIRPDEVVAELRELRARARLEQEQAMQAQQAIEGAKQLSETDTSSDNALTSIVQQGAVG